MAKRLLKNSKKNPTLYPVERATFQLKDISEKSVIKSI